MASSLALKRLLSSNLRLKPLLPSPIRPIANSPSAASRYFNTNVARDYDDDAGYDERGIDIDRSSDRSFSRHFGRHDFLSGSNHLNLYKFSEFVSVWTIFVNFFLRKNVYSSNESKIYTLLLDWNFLVWFLRKTENPLENV